ncbi:MAG: hypothetical protein J6Q38_04195 [Clostridia bacterium]|nr:hypothetical protein [Clostridia bacterium]
MDLPEILLIIACASIVVAVIVRSIIRRKNGKTCSGDCSCCSSCISRKN